ncbi:MAG TPA: chromosome partitioning protein ParB, partial [Sphingomicrobium sp.]|nr:chromosome partitioning protein ParB [Sphingomicrobium sp.]
GRVKVEGWVPKWVAFPPAAYTARGGVGSVQRAMQIGSLNGPTDPQPNAQTSTDEPHIEVAAEAMAEAA